MSKESDECYTPIEIIRALGEFDLDPACGIRCKNKTARHRFTKNGLERKWFGRIWLNPPFSEMSRFARRFTEHGNGIALLAFSSKTKWQDLLFKKAGAVFFFYEKLKFIRPDGSIHRNRYITILVPIGKKNIEAIRRSGIPGLLLVADKLK